MVAKIVVFFVLIGMTCAATWLGNLPMKPKEFAHKEGCYVWEINDVIPFGETIYPVGYCYRISCGERIMDYASCGAIGFDENDSSCHRTAEDLSKPYPSCCPEIKCDVDNNII